MTSTLTTVTRLARTLSLSLVMAAASLGAPAIAGTECGDWAADFGQPGVNNTVNVSIEYMGHLYIAGNFSVAGGANVSRIAKWENGTWLPVGTGVNGTVEAMYVFNGELIVAGSFTQAGGIAANRIAKWNGATWSPMGAGFDSTVNYLTQLDGTLVAGGNFQNSGTTQALRVAQWNGGGWEPIGAGFNASVKVVAVYNDELYAAGTFASSGDLLRKGIARWDGTAWQSVGAGIAGTPETAEIFDGKLVIGGSINNAGGASVLNIAAWDGQNWSAVGEGLSGSVLDLIVTDEAGQDVLIAGGGFTADGIAPSLLMNRVARFDGVAWQPMGGAAMGDTVQTLTVHNGALIAAGAFTTTGVEFTNRIANFIPCSTAPACTADLDRDGQVSAADLATLLGSWGICD
ncbi:MAG: hypothetical protein JNL80_16285 [Phycisphaerae bacterium]|nr:hypothetical protein [Phycisphaerae bacterium]